MRTLIDEIGFDYNTTSIKNVGSSAAQYSTKLDNDRDLCPHAQLLGATSAGQVRSGQVRSGQVRSGQVRSGQVRSGVEDSFEVDGVLDNADLLVPLGQRL
jgi:hypothetical protein